MGALAGLFRARGLGAGAGDWSALAQRWGGRYGVDPALILAVIQTESSGNPNAIGAAGEIGLMQVKPATASWMLGRPVGAGELLDPDINVQAGTAYLAWQQGRGYDLVGVISGYNAGTPTAANSSYVDRVLAYLQSLVTPTTAEAGGFPDSGQGESPDQAPDAAPAGPLASWTGLWDTVRRYWPWLAAGALGLWLVGRR